AHWSTVATRRLSLCARYSTAEAVFLLATCFAAPGLLHFALSLRHIFRTESRASSVASISHRDPSHLNHLPCCATYRKSRSYSAVKCSANESSLNSGEM